jgi:hypothetical protein
VRIDTDVLEHVSRAAPLDNAAEDVFRVGPLKRDVESETIAIKPHRRGTFVAMKNGAMPDISGLVM